MACGIAPHGPAKLVRTCRGCGWACRGWLYGPVRRQAIGRVECAISVFGCHRFRYRADHRSPTICAVFYSWFTCALCFGKWIPVHGANRHPSCTHIQGGFFADGPFRRWDPDRVVALYLLARRICRGPISLCAPEKKRPLWYRFGDADAPGDRGWGGECLGFGMLFDVAFDCWTQPSARHNFRSDPTKPVRNLSCATHDRHFGRRTGCIGDPPAFGF